MSITPRTLAELLRSAGYPVTERRLTDWRAKGWITEVRRGERLQGTGRGAVYEWQDSEIIAHVFTLLNMLDLRGRMETACVLAWFCGFNVPRDDIRKLWVAFENLPWERALLGALAGKPGSVKDALDVLLLEEVVKQRGKPDGFSADFVDIMGRMGLDPAFDARKDLPVERVEKILAGEDIQKFSELGTEIVSIVSADVVRSLAVLVQDYWSAPRLMKVIQSIPDETLVQAHADVRFLLTPYLKWVESSVVAMSEGDVSDYRQSMLWAGPRLAWKLGRFLMQVDIALRRLGCEKQVDATIALLRDVATRHETREVVRVLKEYWSFMAPLHDSDLADDDLSRLADEFMAGSGGNAARDKAAVIAQGLIDALKELWLPQLGLLLHKAAAEGFEDQEM